jgi:uncharacterized protein
VVKIGSINSPGLDIALSWRSCPPPPPIEKEISLVITNSNLYPQGGFMRRKPHIEMPRERIAEFCQKHHIRRLSLFGSVLSDEFAPESDIDVLVEFEAGQVIGLLRLAGMEIELSEMLGRKVDLRTPEDLSRYFRKEVLDSAEVQYAQG